MAEDISDHIWTWKELLMFKIHQLLVRTLPNNDVVSSDIYNLLSYHYIKPSDDLTEFFIKSEAPTIFLKLKTVLKHLNKYILELDSKTKIKIEKKIEIAIEDCNYTISELRREYKLREREEEIFL
jgi:hypothetical protein